MKRSYIMFGSILVATGAFTHCSSSPSTNDGGTDGTAPTKDSGKEVSTGQDAGSDAGNVTPAGTELYPSDDIQIFGVTTDGYVIFADSATTSVTPNALYAVLTTGGTPQKLITPSGGYTVGIAGKVVFVWTGVTTTAPEGALSLWISTGSLVAATAHSSPDAGFAASTDGTKVIYSANSNTGATVSDFVGANVDNTSPSTLVTGVDITTGSCTPVVGFAGTTTIGVTATCLVNPGDGGTPVAIVSTYGAAWAPTPVISDGLNFWSSDTAGDKLLVGTTTNLQVFPLPTGTGATVDSKSVQNGLGYVKKNGNAAIYSTSAGDLWESPLPPTTPLELQTTGVKLVRAISPDDNYVIYSSNLDSMMFGGDLYLSSTTTAATAVTLDSMTTGALFGQTSADDFTSDSKYVLWIENLNTMQGIGDLYAATVAGGTPAKIAGGEWQNASATGSIIVYNNNCGGCSGTGGTGKATADLYWVDVSTTTAPALLQAAADVPLQAGSNSIYMNPAKDHVIYTYSQDLDSTSTPPLGGNGLYSVAIP